MHFLKPFLVAFLFLISIPSFASQAPLKFQQLSTEQGLSQSSVYSIAQDQQGFIWIATQDGLNRYDGLEVKHYRNDLNTSSSLPNNLVRVVFVDSDNTLWVGTQKGLSIYNPKLDNFTNFYHEEQNLNSLKDNAIWNIFEDNKKSIWISTSTGLHLVNKKEKTFSQIHFKKLSEKIKEIKTIYQDVNDNLWLGTYENGLYILDKNYKFISPINGKNKWKLNIPANSYFEIKEIDNQYWIATELGIFIVDKSYNLIKTYSSSDIFSSNEAKIRSIHQIDNQLIWLGTESGLFELNLIDDTISKKNISFKNSNSASFIYTIFSDSSNSIWLGTIYNGAAKYNSTTSLFAHHISNSGNIKNNIKSFTELPNRKIIAASEASGLFIFSSSEEKTINIPIDLKINSIYAQSNSSILIITNEDKLYEYDLVLQKLTPHEHWLNNYKEKHARVDFIFYNDAIFFGGSDSRLYKYSIQTKSLTSYEVNDLNSVDVIAIKSSQKNIVWAYSSDENLYQFNILDGSFEKSNFPIHPTFNEHSLYQIKESTHFVWFSFWGHGILLLDKHSKTYSEFNELNGLANNFITGLEIDNSGMAWLSSNKGVSKINPINKKVINFTTNHGIQSEEFFAFSSLKATDGRMYFGGVNGFNSFYPIDINTEKEVVTTPINIELLVANKPLKISNDNVKSKNTSTIDGQLFTINEITLQYTQSPFSIKFASPNSTFSPEVKYRYKLMGLDEDWIITDAKNKRATYTNLDSGSFIFKLEAYSDNNDIFIPAQELKIHILAPWWFSKTAWSTYILTILLVIYYFIRQAKNKEQTNIQIKASEERLKLALWGSGDEMWDWNMQTNQMYRSNIWGTLDFPTDNNRNDTSEKSKGDDNNTQNIHPQDYQRVKQALEDHKTNKTEHYEAAYRVRDKEGTWVWVLDRGKVVERDNDDMPIRMTGTLKDISQIKQTEESLKLFAKCIENISDAVVVYDSQFKIVDCNLSFQRITGQTRSEALRQELAFNSYPDSFLQNLKKNLIHHGSWQGEIESKRMNGDAYLIDITLDIIRDENEKISHFVGVFSDITIRKETEAELRKLANSDTLTGLPNRSFFQANHSQLVAQDVEHALLVFDLDNFKKINDSLGHQIGDVLLCKVTERIATVGNIKDTCYRLGGDEFSLIIEGTNDIHKITSIADEVLNTIAEPYFIRNQEIALSCSIGIVLFPDDGDNSHELLKNADTAMYHAKDKGGDTYQFFNDSMNKQAVKRLQIENLIRHGLKEDLFSVYYQPKIEVKTGKIKGMEALVRFEAGKKGIIRPDIFIPISEETGQIIEIGEVVLRKACLATKAWLDNGMFKGRIAVNLSAVQFRQPNLAQIINEILEETKLPAEHLELEITEGTVMDSPAEAIKTMLQIRKMGIHLSLDDFGTGYSSLAYLKKFPLNTLKIDKAFIDDIEISEAGRNMVATIVTIAHNLGMEVVAEGVEYEKQLNYLKSIDCEQLQGYLYSRPLSEEDFGRYLLSHIITDKSTPYTSIE